MKNVKVKPEIRVEERRAQVKPQAGARPAWWIWAAWMFASFIVLLQVYGPALNGPFIFDDDYLPFSDATAPQQSFVWWLRGVRPVLMLTYWINYQISGAETFGYHFVNLLIHLVNASLVVAIVRRLLRWAGAEGATLVMLPLFAGSLFLLHPAESEAVAYLAGRSDGLSTLFYYAALAAFLYRPKAEISWPVAGVLAVLFGLSLLSKEQAITLPLLLALTDYWWNPGFTLEGLKKNWRLYVPLILGALAVIPYALQILSQSNSAGSAIKDFTWNQYLYTQFEVIWTYVRLFIFPVNLNGDYDFGIVRSLAQPGALVGLAALAASVAAAWIWRKRFPLATYGWLTFLLLLVPTSSVLPILDPIVERRLYLPSLGLVLILLDVLRRWKISRRALAGVLGGVLLLMAGLTYQRATLWGDVTAFWQDTVRKSPNKWRAHFQLGYAYLRAQKFADASSEFAEATRIDNHDPRVMVDWALALANTGQNDQAEAKLRAAIAKQHELNNGPDSVAHTYAQLANLYGKQKRWPEAIEALNEAQKLNPNYDMVFAYRGNVLAAQGELEKAKEEFEHALALNPANVVAQQGITYVAQQSQQKQ